MRASTDNIKTTDINSTSVNPRLSVITLLPIRTDYSTYFFEQTYYPIQQYAYLPPYFLAAGIAGLAGALAAGAPTEA